MALVLCSSAEQLCSFPAFSGWQVNVILPLSHEWSSCSYSASNLSPPLKDWSPGAAARWSDIIIFAGACLNAEPTCFFGSWPCLHIRSLNLKFLHNLYLFEHFALAQLLSSSGLLEGGGDAFIVQFTLSAPQLSTFLTTRLIFSPCVCAGAASVSSQEIYYCLRRQALFSALLHVIITLHYLPNRPFVIS